MVIGDQEMKGLLGFLISLGKIGEALSVWADPKRREVVKLRLAIEAADHLMQIKDKVGEYEKMSDKYREKYRIHWKKRWIAYKDGV